MSEADRRAAVSVAISFGDTEALKRLGSGVVALRCPECGAMGRRLGHPGEPFLLQGFAPKTQGGLKAILATCDACKKEVTLPHERP